MSSVVDEIAVDLTAADIVAKFGLIPLRRIRMVPTPGTATEEDAVAIQAHTGRLCELIDELFAPADE